MWTHHLLILSQDQVISAHGHTEDDSRDSLEAVDPLLPLWPLASDVKHPAQRQTSFNMLFLTLTDRINSFKVSPLSHSSEHVSASPPLSTVQALSFSWHLLAFWFAAVAVATGGLIMGWDIVCSSEKHAHSLRTSSQPQNNKQYYYITGGLQTGWGMETLSWLIHEKRLTREGRLTTFKLPATIRSIAQIVMTLHSSP